MTKGHSPWSDVNKVVVTTLRTLYRIPLKDVKSMLVKGASHSVCRDSPCRLSSWSRVSLSALCSCRRSVLSARARRKRPLMRESITKLHNIFINENMRSVKSRRILLVSRRVPPPYLEDVFFRRRHPPPPKTLL